jgi:predicted dehydrogenase
MKLGLVGFGYWGKIIHRNLNQMNIQHIVCDSVSDEDVVTARRYQDLPEMGVDHVIIATPVETHYECVIFFLNHGINVFCEKPLTLTYEESVILYNIAKEKKIKLFVDWIFTFNKSINYIKYLIEVHSLIPINIMMNRLNNGPMRYDVNAKFDLSSHDLSIISYLFPEMNPYSITSMDFNRNDSDMEDSSFIFLKYEKFNIQINSSWGYGHKDRRCIFQFDKGVIEWDDNMNILDVRLDIETPPFNFFSSDIILYESPLKNSISFFLYKDRNFLEFQENITLNVSKILTYENKIQRP